MLKKCSRKDCNPVEQSRGQMKPEDHHRQYHRYHAAKTFMEDHGVFLPIEGYRRDAFEVQDQGPANAHDMRVSCSRCGKSTGWGRRDIEESHRFADGDYRQVCTERDGNVDAIRQQWNDMVAGVAVSPAPVIAPISDFEATRQKMIEKKVK